MAVVITSDDSAYFAAGMRRSHSQPKLSSTKTPFRQSSSASRISDIYQQQAHHHSLSQHRHSSPPPPHSPSAHLLAHSPSNSAPSSPREAGVSSSETTPVSSSPTKTPVTGLRLPPRLDRPGYGSSPVDTDDSTEGDVAIDYPHYDGVSYFNPAEDLEPLSIPHTIGDSYAASPNDNNTLSSEPSRSNSSDFEYCEHIEHAAEDDTAVRALPSRHVDYLSHNWREEDIWESWKYIVSRRGDYSNAARLENASWRTWMKSKNNLKTVSPETLNWLKDCDVTWLYGPLQTGHTGFTPTKIQDSAELTKSNSFLANSKKPILKKRSMSELMLQRSISASSLLKQAAAAVQAQQKEAGGRIPSRPRLERSVTDYSTFPYSSSHFTPGITSMMQSNSSSDIGSPSSERKHIHFNEQVEQCIAVEVKDEEDDDEEEQATARYHLEDSDSDDDGAIMMKRTYSRGRPVPRRRHTYATHNDSKTIAMLPSTTLKYQDDLDPSDLGTAMKHTYRSPVMSPSSSQETLRPSKTSGKMFFAEDDDDEDEDDSEDEDVIIQSRRFGSLKNRPQRPADDSDEDEDEDGEDDEDDEDSEDDDFGMSMGSSRHRSGGLLSSSASTSRLGSYREGMSRGQSSFGGSSGGGGGGGGLKRTTSTSSLSAEPAGMRRTASGMFMPYDEGEPAGGGNGGLVGRVIDTVNTARDIIHVIWNVGWRK